MTSKTLLLDADIFMYKCLFESEEDVQLVGEEAETFSLTVNMDKARSLLDAKVDDIVERIPGGADVVMCMTDKHNFRKEIYPPYKEQRKSHRRPLRLKQFKADLEHDYTCVLKAGLEADDVLGILATGDMIPGRKLVVSIDKDLLQIPGYHLNPDKIDDGVQQVTQAEGDHLHMMQTLTGDSVDNYPGCPGIGKVRAERLLAEADDPWAAVVEAYAKKDLTEDDALVQARIARILTTDYYDFDKKEPILWTP